MDDYRKSAWRNSRQGASQRLIGPGVICCQHGWWQECKDLELPGYDSYGAGSANPSLLIGSDIADPISGSLPHRSFLCRVKPAE